VKCCKIKYVVETKGQIIVPPVIVEEVWNWKLFHNGLVELLIFLIIIGTMVGSFFLKSKYSYFGIVGIPIALLDFISGLYFKLNGLEQRLNGKTIELMRTWKAALSKFGTENILAEHNQESYIQILEIVERTGQQEPIPGMVLGEHQNIKKVGFGRTYYAINIVSRNFTFRNSPTTCGAIIRPLLLLIAQIVAVGFAIHNLEDMNIF